MQNLVFETETIVVVHLVCCLLLTGLIWTVQLVHYPAFLFVDALKFQDFAKLHTRNISLMVAPLMGIELLTGIALLPGLHWTFGLANLLGIGSLWLVTFFVSVPLHKGLGAGKDESTILKLIRTNWIRTIVWTLRSFVLVGYFLNL